MQFDTFEQARESYFTWFMSKNIPVVRTLSITLVSSFKLTKTTKGSKQRGVKRKNKKQKTEETSLDICKQRREQMSQLITW